MEGIEERELTLALGGDSKLKHNGVRIFGEIRASKWRLGNIEKRP
ncbi:hypothetical protein C359_01416 [Cryptococcus neoformans Bt120]|nr:hypothetical protein C359_01416 [Cryptococcus neoformans var. grubii Bt120]